ncbi:MAG: isoprenyl transferase [Opitutales bacterium]
MNEKPFFEKIFFTNKAKMTKTNNIEQSPKHIAIIMDGNGRWAKERKLPRASGHKKGAESVLNVAKAAEKAGVEYLTLYAFSSENWSRPKAEINALMSLLLFALKKYHKNFIENNIRFETIGDLSKLPSSCQKAISSLKKETENFSQFTLVLALNYGSRNELVYSIKELAKDLQNANLDVDDINYEKIASYFYTKNIPDPDLIIRTSGEHRLSNYLLMQSAYAEFYFTETYWPDFGEEDFNKAIESYLKRKRRFGKTQEQIK